MEYRFTAEEWQNLSPEERIRRCELMAKEAMALAQRESTAIGEDYKLLAEQWQKLAEDMRASLAPQQA